MIKWNKLFKNPIRYFKVLKRKNKIFEIRANRIITEMCYAFWNKSRNDSPLLAMQYPDFEIIDTDKFIYVIPEKQ